ncbi:unnamed protein product [Macrosiphum euphorbiae]|uniref:Fungal-type protein kinase domain-containing protein n=1 Tax=Macrosiphum euphorbiae TaxID=13131 RepID=A0AAV0VSI2_9HEMI|nr:unnamed protein product [Macrosiphum euphorbiae]
MFIAFVAEVTGEAILYGLSRYLDTVVRNSISATGKTEVWTNLYGTYASLRSEPHFNESNAVTNDELFDVINPTSRECVDELFSCLIRDPSQMADDGFKLFVMNGDIDPMRIESLNTVMDDNKVLTLPGNERIALTQTMCPPFDLSWSTTPATVFHSGILTPDVTHKQMLCTLLDCLLTRMAGPPETARDVHETYFVFTCLWVFSSATFQDQLIDWRLEFSKWRLTEILFILIKAIYN